MKVMVVDDEPWARDRLVEALRNEAGVEALVEARGGEEAVSAIRRLRPDLVFLDIQMPDLDGFEVLRRLDPPLPDVIFVTAFDEHAIRAFEVHAVDYLLKPWDTPRLRQAVERARFRRQGRENRQLREGLRALLDGVACVPDSRSQTTPPSTPLSLSVKHQGQWRSVPVQRIRCVEAAGNYLTLHLPGERLLHRATMTELEEQASPPLLRIHRSWMVHEGAITDVRYRGHRTWALRLVDGLELSSGPRYHRAIRRWLERTRAPGRP